VRYAIDLAPLGELSDPRTIVRLARATEAAGWDGLSIWDSTGVSMATAAVDPFVGLAAAASATERIRLIASVIALPRRRPHLVAQAAASVDLLSEGRLVLGVGDGGDPADFEAFGESFDRAGRLASLDEGLGLVEAYLRGETVSHDGPAYRVAGVAVGPRPVQRPRPPIWLGGMRPGALRRAAPLEGWIAIAVSDDGASLSLPAAGLAPLIVAVHAERERLGRAEEPFDVALFAFSAAGPTGVDLVRGYEAVGVTWWLESLSPMRGPVDALLARIEAGPPS
jgi:alkanesulfonate monooxygenase SsuD/methylene tetrahydromethanopterin reductase-like flavin-dependent oxidoreductase (luciferase family)